MFLRALPSPLLESARSWGRSSSDGDIRKRWIQLSKELHPDQLRAQGVPQELIIKSEDRLSEINQAYDKIKSIRKIN